MAEVVHPISPDDLQDDALRARVYADRSRTLYWSTKWEPGFYVALARAGFISIAYDHPALGPLLLPEIQSRYAVLDWSGLHVSRKLHRLQRSGRLESDGVELRVSRDCGRVVGHLVDYHAPRTWLLPRYRELIGKLAAVRRTDFAIHGVELVSRRHGRVVAGELGYSTGSVYTSLSGFCARADPAWRHFGSLQMVWLAERLRDRGYAFWNLGHPGMAYKRALGARTLSRRAFLARWLEAVDRPPARGLDDEEPVGA